MAIGATKPDRRSFDHEERENRRFLSHHANLTHALKKLSRLARSGQPIPSETLTEALKPAVASAAGIDRRLRKRIRPAIYNERCPPQARHLAQKVFDIPELLEMIILSLRFKDKLKVQRLNKQWHAAVNNSINVQRSLSLRPDTSSGFFRAPFADPGVLRGLHAGFRFYTEGPYGRPQTIEVSLMDARSNKLSHGLMKSRATGFCSKSSLAATVTQVHTELAIESVRCSSASHLSSHSSASRAVARLTLELLTDSWVLSRTRQA